MLSENCNSPADNSFLLLGGFKCENQLPYCTQANIVFNEDGNYTFSITAIIDNVEDIDTWTGTYNVLDETIEICNGTCDNLTIEDEYLVLSFFREGSGCDIEWKFIKEE